RVGGAHRRADRPARGGAGGPRAGRGDRVSVVLPEDLLFAVRTARGAGELAMRWFQSDALVAEGKADGSPVTEADRAAERFVRSEIERRFPGDGVIGEEFGETRSRNGRTWVVDPIDGPRSFVQ